MTRVLFLGSQMRSLQCLRHLADSVADVDVVAVVPNRTYVAAGEDQDIVAYARRRGIPVIGVQQIAGQEYDLGISVLFDQVLPRNVVDQPRRGWVNFHMGPLPRLRGVNSVLHAIRLARRDNQWTFGVTLHYMDHTLDTGPVIDQLEVAILQNDTARDLHVRASESLHELFVRNIDRLVHTEGRLPARPQTGPSYLFRRSDVNHEVDLSVHPDDVYDLVRALTFPGKSKPYAVIGGRKFYLSLTED